MQRFLLLVVSHGAVFAFAFSLGIYSLPIIMAPDSPSNGTLALSIKNTRYVATIANDLADSDWLHWGKGKFSVGDNYLVFQGELAPGPAYRLYLSPTFIETEADFKRLKSSMAAIGEVNSFDNYVLPIPKNINIEEYTSIIIWCETFSQFITAAQYRQ
jgi:Electron transfer DM13